MGIKMASLSPNYRGGGILCHERQLQGLERKAKVEGSQLRLYKAKERRNEGMREAS
jgi:hypothetical protein